jgi:hypothetical protein
MSADRCPSCTAAVRPDASWCSQCYADLRPAPAPAPPPAPVATVETLVAEPPAPATAEVPATVEVPAQATPALPGVVPVDTTPPAWPCARCRTPVPFDDDECPNCHAKFLDPDLPGVQKTFVDRLPRGQRKASTAFLVMVVGGLTLTGIFVALFAILGAIF